MRKSSTSRMVALHKDRRMLTLKLQVARLSGIGADTMFLGVMQGCVGGRVILEGGI